MATSHKQPRDKYSHQGACKTLVCSGLFEHKCVCFVSNVHDDLGGSCDIRTLEKTVGVISHIGSGLFVVFGVCALRPHSARCVHFRAQVVRKPPARQGPAPTLGHRSFGGSAGVAMQRAHRGLEERFWVCLGDGQVHQGVLVLEPVNPDPGHPWHHVESQCWPKVLNQLRLAAASKSVIQTDTVPNRCVHTWWQPRCYDGSLSRIAYSSVKMSCCGCHHCLRLCALANPRLTSSIFTTGNNPHTRHAVPQEKQAGR